jgi:hypothetical protein
MMHLNERQSKEFRKITDHFPTFFSQGKNNLGKGPAIVSSHFLASQIYVSYEVKVDVYIYAYSDREQEFFRIGSLYSPIVGYCYYCRVALGLRSDLC